MNEYRKSERVLTVHPPKALTRNHLEINTLVPVFRIDQMRKFDRVELMMQTETSQLPEPEG